MRTFSRSEVLERPNSSFLFTEGVFIRESFVTAIGVAPWDDGRELDDVDAHVTSDSSQNVVTCLTSPHNCGCWLVRLVGDSLDESVKVPPLIPFSIANMLVQILPDWT